MNYYMNLQVVDPAPFDPVFGDLGADIVNLLYRSPIELVSAWAITCVSPFLCEVPIYGAKGGNIDRHPVDQFYEPARLLSGQDLESLARCYNALLQNRDTLNDGNEQFQSEMSQVFSGWTGKAAVDCAGYTGQMIDFIKTETEAVDAICEALVTTGVVIAAARDGVLKHMNEFTSSCQKLLDGTEAKEEQATYSALSGAIGSGFSIAAAVESAAAAGAAASPTGPFAAIIAAGVGVFVSVLPVFLDDPDYESLVDSYLTKTQGIVDDARNQINNRALPALDRAFNNAPVAPPVPLNSREFDRDHSLLEPD